MPVFRKFRLVTTLVPLAIACLLVGLLQAQIGSGVQVDSRVGDGVVLPETRPLPVPPRHLPSLIDLDQQYPSTGVGSYVEQVTDGLPMSVSGRALESLAIKKLPSFEHADRTSEFQIETIDESVRVAKVGLMGRSAAKPQSSQNFSLGLVGPGESNRTQAFEGDAEVTVEVPSDVLGVGEDFVVPAIPAVLLNQQLGFEPNNEPAIGQLTAAATQQVHPVQAGTRAADSVYPNTQPVDVNPADRLLWWKKKINSATDPSSTLQSVETNSLVYFMLQRSPRLRAVSQNPLIREQQIVEAEAAFDPVSFLQTQFQDRVDPVGDTLSITNDGTEFLDDHIWTADLGVRRKTTSGATLELNQRLGFRNSNSSFFTPQDQGTATLALNVTQPLLRGRGKYFNRSQILIAQSATNASWDTLSIELQNEIQSVVEAYWRLYFDRCVFLQKKKNVLRAESVLAKLEGRSGLDALPSQIARARSAMGSRRTELANAKRDIRNSETDIRRLIADSNWAANQMVELLPIEMPDLNIPISDLEHVIATALNNRAEIREAVKRSKVAAIQRDISVNELLPELSLLLGTYVSALEGESRIGDAFVDQFGSVKPGYSVGIEFELPIRNRAARSRLNQRKLQINLIKAEIDETVQNVIAESQIARRRVISAKETLTAAIEAIHAARLEMEQNNGRWEAFALVEGDIVEGQSPTIVLDRLLDSQERLAAAELVYAEAEMELKVSEVAMQRTMGTLLIHRSVNFGRGSVDGTPAVDFNVGR